jgi:hypothetical protein
LHINAMNIPLMTDNAYNGAKIFREAQKSIPRNQFLSLYEAYVGPVR